MPIVFDIPRNLQGVMFQWGRLKAESLATGGIKKFLGWVARQELSDKI
jgi:hypothetical protein